jgi:hypothetical protein
MNKEIDTIRRTRIYLLGLVKDLTAEQLNEIPGGLNNNIIWNLGHLLVTQQRLCYLRSEQKIFIDDKYAPLYDPGTKPKVFIGNIEIEEIKQQLLSSIDQFENDYVNNLFSNYENWTTQRYGEININNIDAAIRFVLYHEGLHAGCIMTLKNLVRGRK